jgi:hypothetical protein
MKPIICYLILISLLGCSAGGTTTGNPITVQLRLVDQQPFAWWRPISNKILIPSAHAAVTNAFFCFKRLRFKTDSSDETTDDNIDIDIGRMAIDPNGTNLATITIPSGVYRRIEFDLEEECNDIALTPSVEFTNSLAPFNHRTSDRMTIKFEGTFTATADTSLDLDIDVFFDTMDTINDGNDIKNLFEALSGDF